MQFQKHKRLTMLDIVFMEKAILKEKKKLTMRVVEYLATFMLKKFKEGF